MANLARIRTLWTVGPTAGSLSTHYFAPVTGATPLADVQACVDRVRDFWTAMIAHIQIGTTWTVDGNVDHIDETNGVLVGSTAATPRTGQGTLAGDPLPYQTQGFIRFNTSTIADGHRLRGRTYIPAPMESENTNGAPVAGYVTALNLAGAAINAAGVLNLCVWHRPIAAGDPGGPRVGSSGYVTGVAGQPSWAVLRSRRN